MAKNLPLSYEFKWLNMRNLIKVYEFYKIYKLTLIYISFNG